MTDRKQFEAMLEALINDDQETAKDIFHNIVVSKSREIYEELLSEDFDLEEEAKDKDEDKEAKDKDEDEKVDEAFGEDDGEEPADSDEEPEDDEGDVGGDAADDMIGDVEDDAGSEEGDMSDEEQSDRILDLEDALEELKAEFEQLMAGEGEPEGDDMGDMGPDMGAGDNMDDMFTKEMGAMPVMEYKHKVTAKMGDNGANSKSVVAGKNDMGGTTANIAKGGTEPDSSSTKGGLLNPSTKEDNAGNVNVPGGNKVKLSPVSGGHGAEKKGKGESADNKKSIVGGK